MTKLLVILASLLAVDTLPDWVVEVERRQSFYRYTHAEPDASSAIAEYVIPWKPADCWTPPATPQGQSPTSCFQATMARAQQCHECCQVVSEGQENTACHQYCSFWSGVHLANWCYAPE